MNLDNTIQALRQNRKGVRFDELVKICDHFFGEARQKATSHPIYKMPWPGDPRVNIQGRNRMAKPYQVGQVIMALERLKLGSVDEWKRYNHTPAVPRSKT